MLHLYNFFHLNLAYSAIEEEDRARVIERCYWPLLRLARDRSLPFGIELSGFTLETISSIDPGWVAELASLVNNGPCELIGCGYAQVIGPLVPSEVTAANLHLGHQVYESLLGVRPKLALLNEQAYSAGMVPLYKEAGYEAIIMEWNNPVRGHKDWNPEWRYLPQQAKGPTGECLSLIWNKSIAFQKFQRYVHGELELDELLDYVRGHCAEHTRALPLYGNDVEIFDFRPGRYMTEAPLHDHGEWVRIDELYAALQREPGVRFIRPSEVLELSDQPGANQVLSLETAAQPTPVKKQDKYNLVRWAVSGRDDLKINTRCYRLYEAMLASSTVTDSDWRELCYLWSSDFRTHITEKRWSHYLARLDQFSEQWLAESTGGKDKRRPSLVGVEQTRAVQVQRNGRFIDIRGDRLQVRLNCLRGLALDGFIDQTVSPEPLCGTLSHGYYDDIRWGADYYSGHLVLETPGHPKIADLNPVEPEVVWLEGGVKITGVIPTPLGPLQKIWWIDERGGRLVLSFQINWSEPVLGCLRLGHLTLMPGAFGRDSLFYRTHNGGASMETFSLSGQEVDHGRPVSFLVSSSHAIGMTGGIFEIGDASHVLRITHNQSQAALVGMLSHHAINGSHFTRLAYSARELDDTSRPVAVGPMELDFELSAVRLTISGRTS